MTRLTTSQAAAAIGISRQALYDWIRQKKITSPKQSWIGEASFRFWSQDDIERVRSYKRNRRTKLGKPVNR